MVLRRPSNIIVPCTARGATRIVVGSTSRGRGLGRPTWSRVVWAFAERVRALGIIFESNHQCVFVSLVLQRLDLALEAVDLVLEVADVFVDVVVVRGIHPLGEPAVSHVMGVLQIEIALNKVGVFDVTNCGVRDNSTHIAKRAPVEPTATI